MNFAPKRCVIAPVELADDHLDGIRTALGLVEDRANVHVLHALPYVETLAPGVVWAGPDDGARRAYVEKHLGDRLIEEGLDGVTMHVRFGDPAKAVAEIAKELGAELVVLPSHGRKGLSHFLIGSVAERIVRFAPCPVLVLKG